MSVSAAVRKLIRAYHIGVDTHFAASDAPVLRGLRSAGVCKLDHHLDVVGLTLKRAHERLRRLTAGDQTRQPIAISLTEHPRGLVPMTLVRVHAADDRFVLEDR